MVATDTIVGIVGAVVLVAVMAGVFVYEYNNGPEEALSPQAHFEEDYAGLAATQDMDGDGVANFEDSDMDGDGIANEDDEMLSTVVQVNQNVPAPAGSPGTSELVFQVVNGSEHFDASLAYTRAAGGQFPVISGQVSGPDGFDPVNIAFTCTGTSCTWSYEGEEPLPAGEYTLALSNTGAGGLVPVGQAATVTGVIEVHYSTPEGGGHSH